MNEIDPTGTLHVNLTGVKLQAQTNLMAQKHVSAQSATTAEKKPNYDIIEISDTGLYAMGIPKEVAELAAQNPVKTPGITITKIRNVQAETVQSYNAMLQEAFDIGEIRPFTYSGW